MSVTFVLELLGGQSDGERIEQTYGRLEEVHGTIFRMKDDGSMRVAVTIDPNAGHLLEHEKYRITKQSEKIAVAAFYVERRREVAILGEKPVLQYAIMHDTPTGA